MRFSKTENILKCRQTFAVFKAASSGLNKPLLSLCYYVISLCCHYVEVRSLSACRVLLVPCNPIQPVAWSGCQHLNQHPLQASLEMRVARNPAGRKTKPVKGQRNFAQGQWPSSRNMQQNVGDDVT